MAEIRIATSRPLLAIARSLRSIRRKIWAWQLLIGSSAFVAFALLWELVEANNSGAAISQAAVAMIPMLAVTNAIALFGAGAFFTKYNTSNDIRKSIFSLREIVARNSSLSSFDRSRLRSRKALSLLASNKENLLIEFEKNGQPLFVFRPFWDGIWYFGNEEINTKGRLFQAKAELVGCAWRPLKELQSFRKSPGTLLDTKKRLGMQGSTWFLKSFEQFDLPKDIETIDQPTALALVELANEAGFYMQNELDDHATKMSRDDLSEAAFVVHFCDYWIWRIYFFQKLVELRAVAIRRSRPSKLLNEWRDDFHRRCRDDLQETRRVRNDVAPMLSTAKRLNQVRIGSIIAILASATALISFIGLLPILNSTSTKDIALLISQGCYSMGAAAVVVNFVLLLSLLSARRTPA